MDVERLHLACLALIAGAGGSLQVTNLNKALFYFDLACLRDEGSAYTGAEFVALKHGPVVNQYRSVLLDALAERGQVAIEEVPVTESANARRVRFANAAPDLGSPERNALAATIGAWAGERRAADLSEVSHENLGWRAAIRKGEGSVIAPVVAMQQVVADDPWLSAEPSSEELARLAERALGSVEPWPFG